MALFRFFILVLVTAATVKGGQKTENVPNLNETAVDNVEQMAEVLLLSSKVLKLELETSMLKEQFDSPVCRSTREFNKEMQENMFADLSSKVKLLLNVSLEECFVSHKLVDNDRDDTSKEEQSFQGEHFDSDSSTTTRNT